MVPRKVIVCTVNRNKNLNWRYNRGQRSLGHLCNVTNYLCFATEVLVFNIVCGVGARLGR